jgi:hypothetical protein
MKLSTQVFASLVATLATLSQSAIATSSSLVMSQNAIDSHQLTGQKLSLPSKIEWRPLSLNRSTSSIEYVKTTKQKIRVALETWDTESCQGICQLSRQFSICSSVKDIDEKTSGLITRRRQKTNEESLMGGADLKLMKLISSQCRPFTEEIPPALASNIKQKQLAFAPSCQALPIIRQELGLERLGGEHYKNNCFNLARKPIVAKVSSHRIGFVKVSKSELNQTGNCGYWLVGSKKQDNVVLVTGVTEDPQMNIDGKNIFLKLVSRKEIRRNNKSIGSSNKYESSIFKITTDLRDATTSQDRKEFVSREKGSIVIKSNDGWRNKMEVECAYNIGG